VVEIYVGPDGDFRAVYSDALAEVLAGTPHATRRASHVEPMGGGWTADMSPVGGPVLYANGTSDDVDWSRVCDRAECQRFPNVCDHVGIVPVPFATRASALAAEEAWLRDRLERGLPLRCRP
jgi:hypothetical protein